MTRSNPKPEEQDVLGPAKETEDHVQGRVLHTRAGTKMGWERLSVIAKAHKGGKLMDRSRCTNPKATEDEAVRAVNRWYAGDRFREAWLTADAGNWATGSDMNRVRVVGCPGSFVDHQIDVKSWLRTVEARLGTNDWMILRRVCGENFPIAEAVVAISPSYQDSTLARFREALDALIEVMA